MKDKECVTQSEDAAFAPTLKNKQYVQDEQKQVHDVQHEFQEEDQSFVHTHRAPQPLFCGFRNQVSRSSSDDDVDVDLDMHDTDANEEAANAHNVDNADPEDVADNVHNVDNVVNVSNTDNAGNGDQVLEANCQWSVSLIRANSLGTLVESL